MIVTTHHLTWSSCLKANTFTRMILFVFGPFLKVSKIMRMTQLYRRICSKMYQAAWICQYMYYWFSFVGHCRHPKFSGFNRDNSEVFVIKFSQRRICRGTFQKHRTQRQPRTQWTTYHHHTSSHQYGILLVNKK